MWLMLLGTKSEAVASIKRVQAHVEAKCRKHMGVLHTDRGGEFMSASFHAYCDEVGIQWHLTTPYSPCKMGL
jgi:transposase InsO family protein